MVDSSPHRDLFAMTISALTVPRCSVTSTSSALASPSTADALPPSHRHYITVT
jgi:hypothetical protein